MELAGSSLGQVRADPPKYAADSVDCLAARCAGRRSQGIGMNELIPNLFTGLVLSGLYALLGLGITIVFGLTRLINFAHGQVLVIGAFVAYTLTSHGYSFWLGFLVGTLVAGAIAFALERGVFRFTLQNPLNGLIVGLGVLIVLQELTAQVWGTSSIIVGSPLSGAWDVLGAHFALGRVAAIAIAVVATAILLIGLTKTNVGRTTKATQENPLAAAHVGVNVGQVISRAFVIGSAAAGAAGAVLGTLLSLDAYQGGNIVLKGFAVAVLGGLGSVPGLIVASGIYGVGESLIAAYTDPSWVPIFTYGIIIAVLLARPSGLMGTPVSEGSQFGERRRFQAQPRLVTSLPRRSALAVTAIVVAVVTFNLLPTDRLQALFVQMAIYAVVAYSLSLLYHNTGMLSIAQGGFMAIGAYASAIFVSRLGWGFWPSVLPAVALSALAGFVIGLPVARARGHYFVFVTFAFGSLIVVLLNNLSSLTGGDSGLILSGQPITIGPISFDSLPSQFYLALGFAIAAALAVYAIQRSPLGMRLGSIRDNERLAISLGLNVRAHKVLVFGISGAIAGVGGALFAQQYQVITPDAFSVFASIQIIVAVLIGGRGLLGPAVGTIVLFLIPEPFGLSSAAKDLGYGILLVATILMLPRGVVPTVGNAVTRLYQRLSLRLPIVAAITGVTIADPRQVVSHPPAMSNPLPSGVGEPHS